jgi:hypothetical protein
MLNRDTKTRASASLVRISTNTTDFEEAPIFAFLPKQFQPVSYTGRCLLKLRQSASRNLAGIDIMALLDVH